MTVNNPVNTKIRFGIMCNGTDFPAWQAVAIKRLLELENVECELLICPKPKIKINKKAGFFSGVKLRHYLWKIYYYFLRRKFKTIANIDLSDELKGAKRIEVETIKKGKYSEYFDEQDIDEIKQSKLDFILRFGFGIIRGKILEAAKYGVWSFHHGDEKKYRGGPPGFWEIYNGDNVTGAILQRLTDKLDGGIILKRGYFKTNLNYYKNRDQIYLESAKWPAAICKAITVGSLETLTKDPSNTTAPIYKLPTNSTLLIYFIKNFAQRVVNEIRNLIFVDYWEIGFVDAPIQKFLEDDNPRAEWFKELDYSKFRADPFGVLINGKPNIWFEEYEYSSGLGFINQLKNEENLTILRKDTHLSYPYLFEESGKIYMIPENADAGKVSLYKLTNDNWQLEKEVLSDFSGVDPTITKHDDLYWLFITNKESKPSLNLHIFFSDSLHGNWTPHPLNPVKTDIRSSRPAGTIFSYDGYLYRPAMDYSRLNQGNVTINKIEELTTKSFKESLVKTVDPYRDSYFKDKIHTLAAIGNQTLIDGGRSVFFLRNRYVFKLGLKKIKKRFGVLT